MNQEQFANRHSLLGLLLAPASVLLLHILRLPWWMIGFIGFIFIWRLQIYRGHWPFPTKLIRVSLVFTSVAAVVLQHREWYSLEPMVSLLMMAFILKILEVRTQRDATVLIFVAYFVAASAFLFEQGIVISVVGFLVIGFLTACLLVLYASQTRLFSRRTFRLTTVITLQAIPLMLLLLFVFPRVGALWSVPLQNASALTGVSDSMSPGDFSQLSRSKKIAFRVSFDNDALPSPSQRYWRGLVLTHFDGRRWQRASGFQNSRFESVTENSQVYFADPQSESFAYEITLEATGKRWLYGIPFASVDQLSSDNTVFRNEFNEVLVEKPIAQRLRYRVASSLNYGVKESTASLQSALLLPEGFNPQTIAQAQEWRRGVNSTQAYINRVLAFYTERFTYTLSPPALGEHTADEFLFSTQSGFCEHFASSFVILMRAVGIPARVVVGYQGGEWNAEDKYLIVRQQEAHAWAEVWIDQQGWVRVDPTAAVAPNRIEQNLSDSLSFADQSLMDRSVLPSFEWASRLALRWDSMNYNWQRWALKYDTQQQTDFLEKLLGRVTGFRIAMLLLIPGMILFALIAFYSLRTSAKKNSKEAALFLRLQRKLIRHGVKPERGETISGLCQRAIQRLPQKKSLLIRLHQGLNQLLYNNKKQSVDEYRRSLRSLKQLLKQL